MSNEIYILVISAIIGFLSKIVWDWFSNKKYEDPKYDRRKCNWDDLEKYKFTEMNNSLITLAKNSEKMCVIMSDNRELLKEIKIKI